MFFKAQIHQKRIFALCLLLVLLLSVPVAGSSNMSGIDLGVESLTLEIGENYSFQVIFEPETAIHALKWSVTDDSIISIDPVHYTVTGLQAGTARILAESFDGYAWDVCTVTVNGTQPKDGSTAKSGSSFISLSPADRGKITSFSINRYLDFLAGSELTDDSYAKSKERTFRVMAAVTPGTEDAQSQRALSFGVKESEPLRNLHVITLTGTLEQILQFTADNADLKEIYEEHFVFAEKPSESEDNVQKAVTLEGNTEKLTSVSKAHELGFTGKGTTVAVIDTGIYPDHPEFEGRVIGQRCYGTDDVDEDGTIFHSPCVSEDNAYPENALNYLSRFSHGTHASGIAAGKGGIAPEANIVAIQVFTDIEWTCSEGDFFDWCPWEKFAPDGEEPETRKCCTTASNPQDTAKAFDYLIGHAQDYPNLTAVNLSMANSKFHETACDDIENYNYFQSLLKNGIIPVLASGNEYKKDSLPESACTSNSFAVGALADQESPILAAFSNHNDLIDITAPGDNINSSINPRSHEYDGEVKWTYYEEESGTSMAAPMVTGAFAIMKQIFPNRSPEQLKQTLIDLSTKDVTQRSACSKNNYDCPEEGYNEVTSLSAVKPILDFSNLENYLEQEKGSAVEPVSITVKSGNNAAPADPNVLFSQYFALTANDLPMDLGKLTLVSREIVQKAIVVESHYSSENYPELDIIVTEESGNQVRIEIKNLSEFTDNGDPNAYAIVPINAQTEISGAIYSGYEIRIPSNRTPERAFFHFSETMKELPGTGFSALHPQYLGEKPLSLNYEPVGLELRIPSLDMNASIVQVPYADNEYPVQWLEDAVGLLEGSALPGKGVSVLTGHNHLNNTQAGPFAFLSRLEPGSKLFVQNSHDELASFTVMENKLIGAGDITALERLANQLENTLTLVTCENELAEGGYANRRVIIALPD